ncbi:MAG: transposase [Rickettsiales bacterium]
MQQKFPELKKMYWQRGFTAEGFFSPTSGNVTDEIIKEYINGDNDAHQPEGAGDVRLE